MFRDRVVAESRAHGTRLSERESTRNGGLRKDSVCGNTRLENDYEFDELHGCERLSITPEKARSEALRSGLEQLLRDDRKPQLRENPGITNRRDEVRP